MKRISAAVVLVFCLLGLSGEAFGQKSKNSLRKSERSFPTLKFANVVAVTDGSGVFLRWSTENERNVLGFYVYRNSKNGSELVDSGIIPGGYLRSRSSDAYFGDYSYFDPTGDPDAAYTIETLELYGKRTRFGLITPVSVPDIRPTAGRSSAELYSSVQSKPAVERIDNRIPADLEKTFSEFVLPPDLPTQRWVAAQPGVKIIVKQKGLYRVTREQLQAAGFDVNTPSGQWQLYVDGREQAMTVGAADAYIEFLGEGMDSVESDTRRYFLIAGSTAGKRIGTRVIRPLTGPVVSNGFAQTFTRRERASYLSSILNGSAENFYSSQVISSSSTLSYNLNLGAIDYSSSRSKVKISVQGLTINPHEVQVTINGQLMPTTIVFAGQLGSVGEFDVDTSLLVEGANTIQMTALAGSNDYALIESVSVDYSRRYAADQNQLSFFTPNYRTSKLTGFASANLRVFDTSAPDAPAQVLGLNTVQNGATYDVTIPSNRGRLLFAVEDSAVRTPLAIVQNFPSQLSTPGNQGQMIIVTHRDWMTEAQTWATYRAGGGLNVAVVDIADIFDEFSYGSQNAEGMTAFFQYAKDNWNVPPEYIMLLGDSTYDPKNYGNMAFDRFVPTELVDTLYEETGSDEALCDFNGDGLAEISVGRIPIRSGAEATQVLNKVMQFEGNLTNVQDRGALFVSDLPIGYDFEGVNSRVAQQLPANMTKVFIPKSDPNARSLILADLNVGRYLVNYSGHGSTLFWAASNFYHKNDLPLMTNQNNLSMFTLLTCLNGYFLSPFFDSFAETAVKTPNGGAVIAWASSGKTTPDIQEIMATRFYNQIGVGSITRIGDLVKDAKQSLVGGRDVRLSWTLLGDPAMKVR